MRDPYLVLGVARDATDSDIKKAYRQRAKHLHPDNNAGSGDAAARFQELQGAYAFLRDGGKRGAYDRGEIDASGAPKFRAFDEALRKAAAAEARRAAAAPDAPPNGARPRADQDGTDGARFDSTSRAKARAGAKTEPGAASPKDDERFADLFSVLRRSRRSEPDPKHAPVSLTLSFEEAMAGVRKTLSLPNGSSVLVTIPPGIEDGQTIRLKHAARPDDRPRAKGRDLWVKLTVTPHARFRRQDRDLLLDLPVSLSEAVLGAKVVVTTLTGEVRLAVPPGSNSGTVLKLRGKGVPADPSRSGAPAEAGDLLVTLKITLPATPDADLIAFVRDWARRHPYDVRG